MSGVARDEVPHRQRSATLADVFETVNGSTRALVVTRLPQGTIVAANAAAAELFGEDATAMVGRRASAMCAGADAIRAAVALSTLAAGAQRSYIARRRLAGAVRAEVWTCVRRFDVEGGSIALGLLVPVDQPPPGDAISDELAAAGTAWASAPPVARSDNDRLSEVFDRLTLRQREVVSALLLGERVPAIAASLFVSKSSIRTHLSVIFRAFGVGSQTELLSLLRSWDGSSSGTAPPSSDTDH